MKANIIPYTTTNNGLLQEIRLIRDQKRQRARDIARRWILLWAEVGAESLAIEDFPIEPTERQDLIAWLEEEGFAVKRPRRWSLNDQIRVVL